MILPKKIRHSTPVIPPPSIISPELEMANRKLEEERLEWQQQKADFEKQIQKLQGKVEEENMDKCGFRAKLQLAEKRIEALERANAELREQTKAAQEGVDKYQKHFIARHNLYKRLRDSQSYAGELIGRAKVSGLRKRTLERKLETAQDEIEVLKDEEALNQYLMDLEGEIEGLRGALGRKQEAYDALLQARQIPTVEFDALTAECEYLRMELVNAKAGYETLAVANKIQKDALTNAEDDRDTANALLERSRQNEKISKDKVWKVESHMEKARIEAEKMAEEAIELQCHVTFAPADSKGKKELQKKLNKFLGKVHNQYMHVANLKGTLF